MSTRPKREKDSSVAKFSSSTKTVRSIESMHLKSALVHNFSNYHSLPAITFINRHLM
uniref:Uncharacterized protein n=1 Tax=Arundo donax TaxID=35708 RepID=A0A0A9FU16_ARUDO